VSNKRPICGVNQAHEGIEVQAENDTVDSQSLPLSPKLRLLCLENLDGRRVASRRAHELVAAFEADMGDRLTFADKLAVRRAAMLSALAEHQASKQLAGQATDIDQMIRLSNATRRAVNDLRLPARDKRKPTGSEALKEHLAKRAAERAGAASEGEL
jgi:hypothetical protein